MALKSTLPLRAVHACPSCTCARTEASPNSASLEALRNAVEASSQADVALRLGISKSVVSEVLSGTYKGNTSAVLEKVDRVYGWHAALVRACKELGSQAKVGKLIGFEPSTISMVVNGKYPSPTTSIELAVRAHLMNEVVKGCPIVGGETPLKACLTTQENNNDDDTRLHSPIAQHRDACRQCPNNLERAKWISQEVDAAMAAGPGDRAP